MSDYNVIHHLEFPNDMNRRHKHVHVADEEVVSDENSDMNMIAIVSTACVMFYSVIYALGCSVHRIKRCVQVLTIFIFQYPLAL